MNCREMKKVTDLLDERARARLCKAGDRQLDGYGSSGSGSEHEADSEWLAALIHGFMEEDDGVREGPTDAGEGEETRSDGELCDGDISESMEDLSRPVDDDDDHARLSILRVILAVIDGAERPRSEVLRSVMTRLREVGFNAGICKTKWETSGGLRSGSYEYIDVVAFGNERRYIIDFDFTSEFEIARPTVKYAKLLALMPCVLVCLPDELRRVVRIAAETAKRSMKARGLHLPPWRKNRYMQAKWFGPYHRTTNLVATFSSEHGASTPRPVVGFDAGKCRPKPACKPAFGALRIAPL